MNKEAAELLTFVTTNIDEKDLALIGEISNNWTPEQTEAFENTLAWFYCGGISKGFKKGAIFGGVAAAIGLSAFAIWCYKKAHKDDNKEEA